MATSGHDDAVDITLRSYETAAQRYADRTGGPGPASRAFLDRFADLVGRGRVLEVGSGPGTDAAYLERPGLEVTRSDATLAFVEMMRAAGQEARVLDIRTDDLGGPWDAVLALAVLLHLNRPQFSDAVGRIRQAVVDGGVFALTLKEGDGDAWSEAKLNMPRHFTYWREPLLRPVLEQARWEVTAIDRVDGQLEPWLFVMARAA